MPQVEILDYETGLPLEVAQKLKEKLFLQNKLNYYEAQIDELKKTIDNLSLDVQILKTMQAE